MKPTVEPAPRLVPLLSELALAGCVVVSFVLAIVFFRDKGYLPQPFVFDTNDTFMDWFNTAYWANNPGAFDVWRTIYPPLSFVFLDTFSLPGCYLQSSFHARDCDWLGRGTIYAFYLLNVVLAWLAFRKADPRTAPMRTAAIALGMPLLFTLERGNLIIAAFAFFVIAHSEVTQSRRWRLFSAAVTINFKPYLVLPVLAHVVKRDWRTFELAGIASVALYLVTLALVGSGTPGEIMSNTANWVVFQSGQVWNEVNYSTSYAPLLRIRELQVPVLEFVPSKLMESIELWATLAIRLTQSVALAALGAAWLQPRALPLYRISAILFGAYLVTQSPGGYTQVFLLFLVFLEPWRRPGPIVALVCAYLLSLLGDWTISTVMELSLKSWLSGRDVNPDFGLTVGHFLRPGLIAVIVWALALDAIAEVVRAHRRHRPSLGLAAA